MYLFAFAVACASDSQQNLPGVKILFTSTHVTSFIQQDAEILQRHFTVDHLITRGLSALFTIPLSVLRADVTFTWFASVYAFLIVFIARLLGKRSIIVIGGVDVAKYPEINYGIWLTPWKAMLVKYAIKHADKVLAVDPFQQQEAKRLAKYDGQNIECVATGYDASVWFPSGTKESFVLTVAACQDEWRLKAKGIDVLLSSARLLPETRFVVIGVADRLIPELHNETPKNVEIIPFVQQRDLLGHYQRAKVYCQPSYTEGLPNSLCEAMLCECIPVGTNVGGIPTAMNGIGFHVSRGDVSALSQAITQALQSPVSLGAKAREHIARNFTLQKREDALVRILQEVVQ
jgi:glycosyltransferase involved in cell wall biosynthesis